jgi:purine nucleosidase
MRRECKGGFTPGFVGMEMRFVSFHFTRGLLTCPARVWCALSTPGLRQVACGVRVREASPRARGKGALFLILLLVLPITAQASPQPRVPIILDTDLGGALDDAHALALALQHPRIELLGITTVHGDAHTRALMACRFLYLCGRAEIPVASGQPGRAVPDFKGQMQYGLRPSFRKRPTREDAVAFLYRQLKERPGQVTIVAVGPLTNLARLLKQHPDCKPWIRRIVFLGGALDVGYNGKPPAVPEWNIRHDIEAAREVLASGVPLWMVPLDVTATLKLTAPWQRRLFARHTPVAKELQSLHDLAGEPTPTLFDPLAVALCVDPSWCRMEKLRINIDERGLTTRGKGEANANVATALVKKDFIPWLVGQLASGEAGERIPLKPTNPSRLVTQGKMPLRVHVVEDYETDIERRWWLAGQLETDNVPPGSTRACRGVLTNDFDARMGDPVGRYTAVIFNPVPGPPMGPKTRLSFRYFLRGTDRLRVQIYTLSKGYHRHLTLTSLPRGSWQSGTVDMTRARRPDGSGGPLSADERIDDIQFYTDAGNELLIDDIVLYDAAAEGEKRPFPRPIFTGWFDTGRQGKEWPGDFAIVAHQPPRTWKAARSVPHPKSGTPWLRLSLRGPRPLGDGTHLRFRYHLTGASTLEVRLVNRTAKGEHVVRLKDLKQGEWQEASVNFTDTPTASGRKPRVGDVVDEIRFHLPRDAELLVDDVLLFE